ncbi:hypothetical protein [Shimia sp. MIT1388]|uniref:hypothetical protein n=1 Tax=Shimia sp. MIT1388 TaxID=3096992 RepID=UPI00399A935E
MSNVVLMYTGNVCSTPMIEYAHLVENVYVPVKEHFDFQRVLEVSPDESSVSKDFADILKTLYARESNVILEQDSLVKMRDGQPIPSVEQKPHMLFKWRSFPSDLPDTQKISEVFAENDVHPLIMLRKSLSHQAIKVFLSEKVYGGRHQQFKARAMSKEDYEAYLAEQDKISITADADDILEIRAIARNFMNRTLKMIEDTQFYFGHAGTPSLLFAEDVFSPLIQVNRFNKALTRLMGDDVAKLGAQSQTRLRKGGLEVSHCANAEEVLKNPKLRDFEAKYQEAAAKLDNLFPAK